jgi:hypothetical protein
VPDRLKLTFFFPYREVSGVPVLFSRLAPYVARRHGADVEIVDYTNGYAYGQLAQDANVRLVTFEDGVPVNVAADRILVMQSMLPSTIWKELQPARATRMLLWTLHPLNFVQTLVPLAVVREWQSRYPWINHFAGRTLLRSFARELGEYASAVHAKGSLMFVDGPTYRATRATLGVPLPSPRFVTVPCEVTAANPSPPRAARQPIRFAWLGRLADFKVPILRHTLAGLSGLAAARSTEMTFTIVGEGPLGRDISDASYVNPWFRIERVGTRQGGELDALLLDTDALFAMGTSALEGAKLGVPTVLLDIAYGRVPEGYVFRWLFDAEEFSLGAVMSERPLEARNESLSRIVDALQRDRSDLSTRTHAYCLAHHALDRVAQRFVEAAADARFTYGEMSPTLRQKGFVRRTYESLRSAS